MTQHSIINLAQQLAQLVLETGERFSGMCPNGHNEIAYGELVFNTGMTGYVETLTDPSYAGQILCFTYPVIGNYGVTGPETWESSRIQVAGVIVSKFAPNPAHYQSVESLQAWLEREKIPYMMDVDTRALVHRLRDSDGVVGAITSTGVEKLQFAEAKTVFQVAKVSIPEPHYYSSTLIEAKQNTANLKTLIVVDCGVKNNSLRCLSQFPWKIKQVPFDYDYTQEHYDALFISNGPGDPSLCQTTIAILKKALRQRKPIFGICLGSQLMAHAIGASTFKLPVGHRAQNHPCLYLAENRAYLTSQNHGYAIDENSLAPGWKVMFRNMNDDTVAGIMHETEPFFSVQFHPEASPGPLDTQWIFKMFYQMVAT